MTSLAQVKDGLSALGSQLQSGAEVTPDFVVKVLTQLVSFTDIVGRTEKDQQRLATEVPVEGEKLRTQIKLVATQMGAEVGALREKAAQQQGAIEVLANKPERKEGTSGPRGILESKAVSSLAQLVSDKTTFRLWNDRLINAVSQVRYGSRKLFKAMMDYVDQEIGGNFEERYKGSTAGQEMEREGTTYERMDEDLYTLLMDKTDGEAALRVRSCSAGQGIRAYMVVYKWFMGTSGQAVADRVKKLMSPSTPKIEAEIADAIERWLESGRLLESMKEDYKLPEVFKITALEQIMAVGQAKLHFETLKSQDMEFDDMLQKCRDYALRRRLEHNHKKTKDDMDVDACEEAYGGFVDGGGGHWECSGWAAGQQEVDFVAKGKAKGKGKQGGWGSKGGAQWGKGGAQYGTNWGKGDKGKGKGKTGGKEGNKGKGKGGKGKGACFNCGQPGHVARECPDSNPYQGVCANCGNWGHTGKYCQHPVHVQDLEEENEEPEEEEAGARGLKEVGLGGLEIGGSVWSLDKDQEGPWTLVKRPRKQPGRVKELFQVGVDEKEGPGQRRGEGPGQRRGDGKYELIRITADSGAADHVAPIKTANHVEVKQTEASKQGVKYVAANGHKIANLGQRRIEGVTDAGVHLGMTWQVADVKKPLASIGRMCDAGNVAVFTKEGGYVVPKEYLQKAVDGLERLEGPALRMRREGGVYNFNLWMPVPPREVRTKNQFSVLQEDDEEEASGFARPGAHLM